MDTLRQLGELLLTSIPTIVFLLIVWGAYSAMVQKKLDEVLAERHARTEGAIEQAQKEIATAEARTAEYEQRLREARSTIFKSLEARRRQMMEKRNAALVQAHQQAQEMIKQARAALEKDVAEARATLQRHADMLATQIMETVLRPAAAAGGR